MGHLSFELTIHQALSLGQVGDPGETVILLQVIETSGLHLARQPFPSVEAHLNGERKPSLDAGIEKGEDRMDLVVVEEQALSPRDSNCVMIQKPVMLPIRFIARTRASEVHFAGTQHNRRLEG